MAISKIVPQSTGFGAANVGLQIPNISLENRAADAANGTIFFNTSNNAIEVYANGAWIGVGSLQSPTITSIDGDIVSGNTGSTISINGTNFGIVEGIVRFNYNSVTYDVSATPVSSTLISNVTIPSGVLTNAPGQTGTVTFISGIGFSSNSFTKPLSPDFIVEYLLVGGGGCGGGEVGGGGGGGGFVTGNTRVSVSTTYSVSVGAGGSGQGPGFYGGNSSFTSVTAGAGGPGSAFKISGKSGFVLNGNGSGAPGTDSGLSSVLGGAGAAPAGFSGGNTTGAGAGATSGSGGGGAGANGVGSSPGGPGGNGGTGAASPITGSPVTYAGGGGGAGYGSPNTGGAGGSGGGGAGADAGAPGQNSPGVAGSPNTGGGGGGSSPGGPWTPAITAAGGGSGIVILKYHDSKSISNPGGGLTTSTPSASGGFKRTSVTAGTGNVSWS